MVFHWSAVKWLTINGVVTQPDLRSVNLNSCIFTISSDTWRISRETRRQCTQDILLDFPNLSLTAFGSLQNQVAGATVDWERNERENEMSTHYLRDLCYQLKSTAASLLWPSVCRKLEPQPLFIYLGAYKSISRPGENLPWTRASTRSSQETW